MTHLSVALLGPIQVTLAGQAITPFKYDKVGALLVYLAVETARAHEREALMGLLWPDLPEEAARNNLRQALVKLRDAISDRTGGLTGAPPFLLTSRAMLQFDRASDYQLDVTAFTTLLDACDHHVHRYPESCKTCAQQLQQAIDLYQGPFLAEFFLPDSAAFEEWALVKTAFHGAKRLPTLLPLVDRPTLHALFPEPQVTLMGCSSGGYCVSQAKQPRCI